VYRRGKIGFWIGLAALLGLTVWLVLRVRDTEPIVEGKPLAQWLAGYSGGDANGRAKADEIIDTVGTNAIPTLLRLLRKSDSALKRRLIELSRQQRLASLRLTPAYQRNYQAALGFARLGPAAHGAIPELIKIYNENRSNLSRFWAINSLGSMGSVASNAIPFITTTLANTNTTMDVRLSCISSLQGIRQAPEITIPALTNALSDQQAQVRYCAVLALGRFGLEARPAAAALTNLLRDPDRTVKQGAADLLSRIQ
jgi:HEAT repeat protein